MGEGWNWRVQKLLAFRSLAFGSLAFGRGGTDACGVDNGERDREPIMTTRIENRELNLN